jgi:transposase-like protein
VLEVLIQSRRNKAAAHKLIRKLLRKHGFAPRRVTTDKFRSRTAVPQTLIGNLMGFPDNSVRRRPLSYILGLYAQWSSGSRTREDADALVVRQVCEPSDLDEASIR